MTRSTVRAGSVKVVSSLGMAAAGNPAYRS
jgi:hypothetical protein